MRFLLPALLAAAALLPARADFLAESRDRSADGEHAAAAELLAKHLQTAAPSAALYFELGQSLEKSGNEPEAALAFRRAAILDPGFAPGTGSPEPGGLLPREAFEMIRTIAQEGLCGMEVVEVSPPYDVNDNTAQLATRVILDVLGTLIANDKLGHRAKATSKP